MARVAPDVRPGQDPWAGSGVTLVTQAQHLEPRTDAAWREAIGG